MKDTSPAPRVLILCADRRLSRGLALYAADMGLDPVWRAPDSLPADSPDGLRTLTETVGAALVWADADDSPRLPDVLPPGFPAVTWSRGNWSSPPDGTAPADGLPVRLRRPLDTALLEAVSRRCLGAVPEPLTRMPVRSSALSEENAPAYGWDDTRPAAFGDDARPASAADAAPSAPDTAPHDDSVPAGASADVPGDAKDLPALTPLEARTYACFLEHRGETVTRETLRELLGIPADSGGNMTDVYVSRLRKKLEKPGERLIYAVRGKGYRMN